MADEEFYGDPSKDPGKNDDSQPSVTTVEEVLRKADIASGVKPSEAKIPAPADAVDLAYRKAVADDDADEIGKAIAEASSTEEAEEVVAEAGSPTTRKRAAKK